MRFSEATESDCEAVAQLAARTFSDTFGHLYKPANLLQHLLEKYSPDYFKQELRNGSTIVLIHEGEQLIGYAKVGQVSLPLKGKIPKGAQELHRAYIEKEFQGRGLGKALMLHILSLPRIATAPIVYLGVWEENIRAQQLYAHYGFEPVGRYLYQVGDQTDREIIMAHRR